MGCGYAYVCRTCKKSYNVGYGSYSTWFTVKTLDEWDAQAKAQPEQAALLKNQNIRKVLSEHVGHDLYCANGDYHRKHNGTLVAEIGFYGADVVVIPDYAEYEYVDLTNDKESH